MMNQKEKQENPKEVVKSSEEITEELKEAGIELEKWEVPNSYPNDRNMA